MGGLEQAIVPIWIKRLRQLAAFQTVLFWTGAHAGLRGGRHRFDPLRGGKPRSASVIVEKEQKLFKAGEKIGQDLQEYVYSFIYQYSCKYLDLQEYLITHKVDFNGKKQIPRWHEFYPN